MRKTTLKARLRRGLVTHRKAAGLTQPELAQRARISRSQISRLENGHFLPSLGLLFAIAEALDVKPEELWN